MKFSLRIFTCIILTLLLIPVLYLFLYSVSLDWTSGIIPQKFSLDYFKLILLDVRFYAATGRTFMLAGISTIILLFTVLLALYAAIRYRTVSISILEKSSFTISLFPPIVMSVGVLSTFAAPPLAMTSTPLRATILLIGLYVLMPIAFVMRILLNGLELKKMRETLYVSEVLGSGFWNSFFKVFIPSFNTPLMIAAPFSFNAIFGEIIYLNLLAGSRLETLMVYIDKMRKNNPGNASAMTVIFYLLIIITTYTYIGIISRKKRSNP